MASGVFLRGVPLSFQAFVKTEVSLELPTQSIQLFTQTIQLNLDVLDVLFADGTRIVAVTFIPDALVHPVPRKDSDNGCKEITDYVFHSSLSFLPIGDINGWLCLLYTIDTMTTNSRVSTTKTSEPI